MSKKYNKSNNMKQAMFEMFGVGEDRKEELYQDASKDVVLESAEVTDTKKAAEEVPAEVEITTDEMIEEYVPMKKMSVSYLAPGTVFEGNLNAAGDVEIAGEFNGDVTSEGNVVLRSAVCGNIVCDDLKLQNCILIGDVNAKETVDISEDSRIRGNIVTNTVRCAGQINGNLNVVGDIALEKTAAVYGMIKTDTISMEKGAIIKGGIEMDDSARRGR